MKHPGKHRWGATLAELFRGFGPRFGELAYIGQGRLPGTLGYELHRNACIERTIGHEENLQCFLVGNELPKEFGIGLDERVVEYPWALSKLRQYGRQSRILDAGSTLNYEYLLRHPLLSRHKWTLVTLAPESRCFWGLGVSYLYEDLRSLPFREGWFDAVFSLSVIEHIGMDNAAYTSDQSYREDKPRDYLSAVGELRRILKPGGWLYLTVPFGQHEDHGWLQQFDTEKLDELISHFQSQRVNKTFFRYTKTGWSYATEDQCSSLAYFDIHARRRSRNGKPTLDPDHAAAARGVACVELQK